MKKIENKTCKFLVMAVSETETVPMTYKDLIQQCIESVPMEGLGKNNIPKLVRVSLGLDKMEFTEEDIATINQGLDNLSWGQPGGRMALDAIRELNEFFEVCSMD